jgi:hypothetical protein
MVLCPPIISKLPLALWLWKPCDREISIPLISEISVGELFKSSQQNTGMEFLSRRWEYG